MRLLSELSHWFNTLFLLSLYISCCSVAKFIIIVYGSFHLFHKWHCIVCRYSLLSGFSAMDSDFLVEFKKAIVATDPWVPISSLAMSLLPKKKRIKEILCKGLKSSYFLVFTCIAFCMYSVYQTDYRIFNQIQSGEDFSSYKVKSLSQLHADIVLKTSPEPNAISAPIRIIIITLESIR